MQTDRILRLRNGAAIVWLTVVLGTLPMGGCAKTDECQKLLERVCEQGVTQACAELGSPPRAGTLRTPELQGMCKDALADPERMRLMALQAFAASTALDRLRTDPEPGTDIRGCVVPESVGVVGGVTRYQVREGVRIWNVVDRNDVRATLAGHAFVSVEVRRRIGPESVEAGERLIRDASKEDTCKRQAPPH